MEMSITNYNFRKLPLRTSGFATLSDALVNNAQLYSDVVAFNYSPDGKDFSLQITYDELFKRASKIANFIRSKCTRGDRVMLLYSSGIEFAVAFSACILSETIAVPAPPPKNEKNISKLLKIASDCKPKLMIYGDETEKFFKNSAKYLESLKSYSPTKYSDSSSHSELINFPHDIKPNDIVLLQYTSGSTGNPKGVQISHRNLIDNVAMLKSGMDVSVNTRHLSWLPLYHDMGFVGVIVAGMIGRHEIFMYDPISFVTNPTGWIQLAADLKITLMGGPNFAFDLVNRRFDRMDKSKLDLSCLKVLFCGSEPIQYEALQKFIKNFEPYGLNPNVFYTCYGMAESTLIVTGSHLGAPIKRSSISSNSERANGGRSWVSVGVPFENEEVIICDPSTLNPLPHKSIGEILVAGSNISVGYWQDEEKTKESFITINQYSYLRTGDLGFVEDGELYIAGRLKDLIIINGRNIYPSDIEFSLQDFEEIRPNGVVASSYSHNNVEHPIVIVEINPKYLKMDFEAFYLKVSKLIFESFEISTKYFYCVKPGGVLRTTSGKVMRGETKSQLKNNRDLIVYASVPVDELNLA